MKTDVKISTTTSQAHALQMNHDAENAAKAANVFLGLGGGLAAAGAGVLVVDFLLARRQAGATNLSAVPTAQGALLLFSAAW